MIRCVAVSLVVFTGLAAGGASADAATTSTGSGVTKTEVVKEQRAPRTKQVRARLGRGDSRTAINVKFAEETRVRLRRGHLVRVDTGERIPEVEAILDRFQGVKITRLFNGTSETQIDANRDKAVDHSGILPVDLNLFFRFQIRTGDSATDFIDQMNALAVVDSAGAEPMPTPAPTANYRSMQGYHSPASSSGIDADYARTLVGGRGEYVRIADIEYGWNRNHEDLSKLRVAGSALANGTSCYVDDTHHGTAVMGQMVADDNGFGVTGLSPAATALTVSPMRLNSSGQCIYALADSINVAANNLGAGDVMLIEQHIRGPRSTTDPKSQYGFVPVEYEQSGAVWSAIQSATARGVIVIEPAGNGHQNLDDPIYNASNGRNWFSYDSGAIMVGAGNAAGCTYGSDPTIARGRLSYSNYGARVNVQGWGSCVTTTGYGDLSRGSGLNQWYSKQFSGTSSASPIVASAAAILSSIAEARGQRLTPAWIRSTLAATGQPQQFGNGGNIGPLPNLRAAIPHIPGGTTTTSGPVIADAGHNVASGVVTTGVPVTQRWSVTQGTAATYEVWLSTNGGAWAKTNLSNPAVGSATFRLAANQNYRFAARAANAAGTWGAWAYSPTFGLGQYQENYASGNPAYGGSWTRAAYAPASGGALAVSSTAGSVANFNFTGNSVAWVATKSANRGSAHVYVDGVYSKTVSLYSATTVAKTIAFTATWKTAGPHRITIRVVGTAGHPKVDVDAFIRLR